MKTICFLGCAWTQIPLVFDVAYETLGIRNFQIFKNIPVDDSPNLEVNKALFKFTVHEPEEWINLKNENLFFGVPGPKAKQAVLLFFKNKYGIDNSDFLNVIHPASYVATSRHLNQGILIEPNVIISTQVKIGFGVTLRGA